MLKDLSTLEVFLNQRRNALDNVLHCWRTRGAEAAVGEAARSGDLAVLVELVDAFNHAPSVWNLTLCTVILPHIEPLLGANNEDYVEVSYGYILHSYLFGKE
ncbi:unnamed protein product [Gongylonema pulchrum]|uniref:Katanin_con80 domain-containing protein n=1 Tax=Gongylonema pulchrum TaxID=637853 RepID=A0A183D6M6_9BILA|nr:unnamed protein product [Gongylonema pulchrum]